VESLSWAFIAAWLLGDICNLIGSILTEQLTFQQILAGYFVLLDCILLGQLLYYSYTLSKRLNDNCDEDRNPLLAAERSIDGNSKEWTTVWPPQSHRFGDLSATNSANSNSSITRSAWITNSRIASSLALSSALPVTQAGNIMIFISTTSSGNYSDGARGFGEFCAWTSLVCYLSSRLPQILKNVFSNCIYLHKSITQY
jgi:hypothetical protein